MEAAYTALLTIAAFILGAIPFSVIIGRLLLKKDITKYGDGNPGAANVFRAGSIKLGLLAVVLDIGKGVPFVLVAHSVFGLSEISMVIIALGAVLGHAFSPFLHWHGGKAIAVTFGVMLGLLPRYEILLAFIVFMVLGFIFIKIDAWKTILGATSTLIYLTVTKGNSWESLLMLCLLIILIIKHFDELHTLPTLRSGLFRWVQRN
jgi:glycerol-3-phosphate acyltransferase PlsY